MSAGIRDGDVVLLVGHGTVFDLRDLPAFLQRIRRGRPAPRGLVEDLRQRYSAIGGSPLLHTTEQLAQALEKELGAPVRVAMRLWEPLIGDVLSGLPGLFGSSSGLRRILCVPVAPYSVHVYGAAVRQALESSSLEGVELQICEPYGAQTELVEAWRAQIAPYHGPDDALVLTAHSLPLSVLQAGDPYRDQVEVASQAIGRALGGSQPVLAYQSQGASAGEWLGPDLQATLVGLKADGVRGVTVAPIGFLSDHVETLFDLDIEAKAWADDLGLGWRRVPALNLAPGLVRALSQAARRAGEGN